MYIALHLKQMYTGLHMKQMYIGLHMKHPLCLSDLNEFYGMIFRHFANAPKNQNDDIWAGRTQTTPLRH